MTVKLGDIVLYKEYGGEKIKLDGEEFIIISEENIRLPPNATLQQEEHLTEITDILFETARALEIKAESRWNEFPVRSLCLRTANDIYDQIMNERVIDFIQQNAKIEDVPPRAVVPVEAGAFNPS